MEGIEETNSSCIEKTVLKHFKQGDKLEYKTDANIYRFRTVLLQKEQDGQLYLMPYKCKKTPPQRKRNSIYKLEILAKIVKET